MELAGHRCIGFCEFDKFAVASYTMMHLATVKQKEYLLQNFENIKKRQKEILREEYRNGEWYAADIRNIDYRTMPRADCWCFGFPCQDISVAGKQLGFNGHRSSLFFAVTRIIRDIEEENKPTYLFIENVKNLLSVNRGFDFAKLLVELDEIGYDASWQVLNSKDYGVPQNRERVFIVGHLRGRCASEILPIQRTTEQNRVRQLVGGVQGQRIYSPDGLSVALASSSGGQGAKTGLYAIPSGKVIKVGNSNPSGRGMNGNIYHVEGLNPTLTTNKREGNKVAFPLNQIDVIGHINASQDGKIFNAAGISGCLSAGHGNNPKIVVPVLTPDKKNKRQNGCRCRTDGEPMFTLTKQDRHGVMMISVPDGLKIKEATKKGFDVAEIGDGINLAVPGSKTRRGRVAKQAVNTLDTSCNQGVLVPISDSTATVFAVWNEKYSCYTAVRKLTAKECFRLQGWTDDYFELAALVNSDNQLYKQAGNGVTVPVITAIAEKL